MTKFKTLIAVMLSVVLVVTIAPITYAHNNEGEILEEAENYTDDASVNPRFNCTYCDKRAVLGCYGEKLMYDRGTHNALSGQCTIFYYWSTSAHKCNFCGRVLETFGYHDCEWRHVGCNAGLIDMCPCEEDIW